MRPLAGNDAPRRSRNSDADPLAAFRLPAAPQMTFTLGDESTVGPSSQVPTIHPRRAKEHKTALHTEQLHFEHSRPRIPSHLDSERAREPAVASRPSGAKGHALNTLRQEDYELSRPVSPLPRAADTPNFSRPLSPVFPGTSGPASALSSVSSRRDSLCLSEDLLSCPPSVKDGDVAVEDDEDEDDDDEINDHDGRGGSNAEQQQQHNRQQQQQQQTQRQQKPRQHHAGGGAEEGPVISSDQGDGGGDTSCEIPPSMADSGSAPQLVMPSIKMPSRRPFTDDGKRMGRLKVLVAGDSGVGKTSLIKAIVQSCDHIVHVDPIAPSPLSPSSSSSLSSSVAAGRSGLLMGPAAPSAGVGGAGQKAGGRRQSARREGAQGTRTAQIAEIYASTKPYPEWWSEVDDLRVLRRRKRLGDAVLDRNICFVDTPGYGAGSS
ncbi:hypothetical protein VTH06DRAFT_2126, partial [Thermothelomyces fergusii]